MKMWLAGMATAGLVFAAGCSAPSGDQGELSAPEGDFAVTEHGTFNEGWAIEFLPGTNFVVVSERVGTLQLLDLENREVRSVENVPDVHHAGQAGMHDIVAGPTFEDDGTVYLSWVRSVDGGAQGVIGRAQLNTETASLENLEEIWEQTPAEGNGHFSLRLLPRDGYLFVTSGDRQEFTPAQETESNLGAVLRLTLDGEPAPGNPFAGEGERADEIWTMGHRNPLGIDTDADGGIWVSEMGPKGGDELNHLEEGENYGWPEASMGSHYDGTDIPDHTDGDGFVAPAGFWTPSISPGSLMIYHGSLFDDWEGDAFLSGLSGQRIVRVELDGTQAIQAQEWDMGERIRDIEEAPDGAIWVLEDGAGGRLLELRPSD